MKTATLIRLTVALLLLTSSYAQAITAPKTIEQSVSRHVGELLKQHGLINNSQQRIDFSVSKIDPNLRLASCSKPLNLKKNGSKLIGRISIAVRCEGNKPWKIYVPVTIKAYRMVVTAAEPLARNQSLEPTLLKLTEKDVSRLNQGYFSSIAEVKGKQLIRSVQLGAILKPNMVKEPIIIKRGDVVMIIAKTGALSVKSAGVALNDGRLGQQIQVKNKASKRVVVARVINSKQVQVVM
jgi:flagella basal body P-ring formation protein FlgA